MKTIYPSLVFGSVFIIALFLTADSYPIASTYIESIDSEYIFSGFHKPESFFGSRIAFLNRNEQCVDQYIYCKETTDLGVFTTVGKKRFGLPALEFCLSIRNKAVWGDARSISQTTPAVSKISETVFGRHTHFIPRHILWIREGWFAFDIGSVFDINFDLPQKLTLGAFRFELGRGISLGSAYAVGPELLGFYSDSAVDQYAFGGKASGQIVEKKLSYDAYAAVLNNRSSNLNDTADRIYGQEFGRRETPARGFGHVNFLVAGRLTWKPINFAGIHTLTCEPYWLINYDPEQIVEFLADASSTLGTIGLASEYEGTRFGFGFDYALNFGHQRVKGWDRNTVSIENRDSYLSEVNSHIIYQHTPDPNNQNGKKIPFTGQCSNAQKIILNSEQGEEWNEKQIGMVSGDVGDLIGPVYLVNTANRFRNPYVNTYDGMMFVADAAAKFLNGKAIVAGAVGYASGDDNPNEETKDEVYSGFIGLQELYSGKRVKSAFILGNLGKVRRPLSLSTSRQVPGRYARSISGFTNLVLVGGAFTYKDEWGDHKKLEVNPNILAYWQDRPTKKFDLATHKDSDMYARTFLGTELNVFVNYWPMDGLKFFLVGTIFQPGGHFEDIMGKPISEEQARAFDRLNRTGAPIDIIPNIAADVGWALNAGIEFSF